MKQKQPTGNKGMTIFLFILPFFALYTIFTIWPVIQGIYVSFHKWGLMGKQEWVGFSYYSKFIHDKFFWQSIGNTFSFVGITVPVLVMLSFICALIANRQSRMKRFLRICFYLPNILSVSVISFITIYMSSPYMGFLNQLFHSLKILPSSVEPMWLSKLPLVWVTISLTTVWWTLGFSMLIFLAALQDIPESLYEASELDGATGLKMLLHITIPILKPTFLLIAFLQIISSFKVFGQIFLITAGGPGTATRPIIQYIYTTAFTKNNLGYASAMSYALFFILIIFSIFQIKLQNRMDG